MLTASKRRHRGSTIWQRRYWEHQIRGETDFRPACNYIYYNPVKHGHVTHAIDWRYSTLHRDIAQGLYPHDWTGSNKDSGFGTLGE